MADILHRIVIETSPEKLYEALTQQQGLTDWWIRTETDEKQGGYAQFFFGPNGEHQVKMEILQLVPNKKIVWKCVEGPWVETGTFEFEVQADKRGAALKFRHNDWPKADEFFMHCNSKWGFFFTVSLKNLLETGEGNAHPMDPSI